MLQLQAGDRLHWWAVRGVSTGGA